jgi:hypothetical protein
MLRADLYAVAALAGAVVVVAGMRHASPSRNRWSQGGLWQVLFAALAACEDPPKIAMVDSTSIRAHYSAVRSADVNIHLGFARLIADLLRHFADHLRAHIRTCRRARSPSRPKPPSRP